MIINKPEIRRPGSRRRLRSKVNALSRGALQETPVGRPRPERLTRKEAAKAAAAAAEAGDPGPEGQGTAGPAASASAAAADEPEQVRLLWCDRTDLSVSITSVVADRQAGRPTLSIQL